MAPFAGGEGRDQLIELGGGNLIPGFEEALVGTRAGEQKEIVLTFPVDYPNEAPVWMVFDDRLRESTMILSMVPGGTIPDWVESAPTLRELAARIDLDPLALERTVDQFNLHAAVGEDPAPKKPVPSRTARRSAGSLAPPNHSGG